VIHDFSFGEFFFNSKNREFCDRVGITSAADDKMTKGFFRNGKRVSGLSLTVLILMNDENNISWG
jgi:hypothetical protein